MHMRRQCELVGQSVRVEFRWQVDRYQHSIVQADGGQWIEVLRSVEDTPQESWPASPPLQSLHVDGSPGGRQLALLVGMAGGSHWSLSVELDPAVDRLHFDVACRIRGQSGPLGSRYRALAPTDCVDARSVLVGGTQRGLRLELDNQFAETRLIVAADCLSIAPHELGSAGAAQTIRWGYSIVPASAGRPS